MSPINRTAQELREPPALDPRTARRLISRFKRFEHTISAMFAISRTTDALGTPCHFEPLFQGPHGLRIASDDPGTPVEIKQKLKKISALCEDAAMAAGARDKAHALPYWLVLLYNHNPRYFESVSEGIFWIRNFPLASIEYLQQFAFAKPGRPPKGSASGGGTFDAKTLRDDLAQGVFAMRCGVSRSTIQRLESGSHPSPKTSKKIREAAQSTLDDPDATGKEKALALEILKILGGTTT